VEDHNELGDGVELGDRLGECQESPFYNSEDIRGPHEAALGRVAQDFIEKERIKDARFNYPEISIFYVFPRLLTGRTVLVVTMMIPGNAKPMKYSVKWRFLDARRQRCHRRPWCAERSFVSSCVRVPD
jgi:hypothetical protein